MTTLSTPVMNQLEIDARGLYYRQLNEQVHKAVEGGATHIVIRNLTGQRYLGNGLRAACRLDLHGTPGQDLAMFMDGSVTINVYGNAQDGLCNTMTNGEVIVHGQAGDLVGHSLRGGQIYVRGSVGYRCGIHMKQYHEPVPVVVIGGTVGDYAGEYMAGGILIVLGLERAVAPVGRNWQMRERPLVGRYLGTGMHGGVIYLRGDVEDHQMGREISRMSLDDADRQRLKICVERFAQHFDKDAGDILKGPFTKFMATSSRPYGRLYVY